MSTPRLEVTDSSGHRLVLIETFPFIIGRGDHSDLRLGGAEVSRDHMEIASDDGRLVARDRGSRYGTFVNDEAATECELRHGDRIRLGRGGGADLVFLADGDGGSLDRSASTAIGDLRQVAALLEGLSALGSGRVLEDVLGMVLDSAIEIGGAERGFIMLANDAGVLEFKLARAAGRVLLSGDRFETSRKIPEQVFETGEGRVVADLLDGDLATAHLGTVALGIRHVLCVPLRLMQYTEERGHASQAARRIGVLYLDSRVRGALLTSGTRAALDTLAAEAAVAIENARLYRYALERAKLDQEMLIAGEIQQAILPRAQQTGDYYGAAATSVPSRLIGGDFFDYVILSDEAFGFALGDVAGKGPPAAILSAMLQGVFSVQTLATQGPAEALAVVNRVLLRRGVDNRFVTIFYATLGRGGDLLYCNAGHNAPFLIGARGVERLEEGGPIVGLFEDVTFTNGRARLDPGDWVVVFSDGVSEALSAAGEEFGDARIEACIRVHRESEPVVLLGELFDAVRAFTAGAPQSDDITAMVVRYTGAGSTTS